MESAKLMYSGVNTIGSGHSLGYSVSREGLSVSLVGLFLGRSCPSHWVFESVGFVGFKWGPNRTMSLQLTSGSFRPRRGHGNGRKFSSGVRRLLAEDGREPFQLCLQMASHLKTQVATQRSHCRWGCQHHQEVCPKYRNLPDVRHHCSHNQQSKGERKKQIQH